MNINFEHKSCPVFSECAWRLSISGLNIWISYLKFFLSFSYSFPVSEKLLYLFPLSLFC